MRPEAAAGEDRTGNEFTATPDRAGTNLKTSRAASGDDGVKSLRGTIGGERKAVKQGPTGRSELFGGWVLTHGKALRLGASRRPVVGRKCDAPEARRWLIKFDADTASVIHAFADVHDFADNLFARLHILEAKLVADVDHLFHQNQRAMGIHHLRHGFFDECRSGWLEATHDDMNG